MEVRASVVAWLLICLVAAVRAVGRVSEDEKLGSFWVRDGQRTLREALSLTPNVGVARNVVLFLGDGMGPSTVAAMRVRKGQLKGRSGEEETLAFDHFPYLSLAKTYGVDRQTSDSANTATAYLCGVKANYGTLGLDGRALFENCESSLDPDTHLQSLAQWAQEQEKWAGVVTTTRVTHATPAGLYAHSASRNWEGGSPDARCPDIAAQLVAQAPGKDLRVILGGGRTNFLPVDLVDVDGEAGARNDSRDLISEWRDDKKARNLAHHVVFDGKDLRNVDPLDTDYLLGLFHSNHLPYVDERHNASFPEGKFPSLPEMTEKAIRILSRNPNGYFLLVEGGKIDIAHHQNWARRALDEGVEFDEAVSAALRLTDPSDTLVVVTADHSHTFTFGGDYPMRGTPIIGVGGVSDVDNKTFTTLGYHTGLGYKRDARDRNLTQEEAEGVEFRVDALVPTEYATHGAEDVAVFALGPHAHLFHGTHQQSYVAHAIGYASCTGPNKELCNSAGALARSSLPLLAAALAASISRRLQLFSC